MSFDLHVVRFDGGAVSGIPRDELLTTLGGAATHLGHGAYGISYPDGAVDLYGCGDGTVTNAMLNHLVGLSCMDGIARLLGAVGTVAFWDSSGFAIGNTHTPRHLPKGFEATMDPAAVVTDGRGLLDLIRR